MKLDDRPVIDQLLDPTPISRVYEVQDEMFAWLLDNEESMSAQQYDAAHGMLKAVVAALEARL